MVSLHFLALRVLTFWISPFLCLFTFSDMAYRENLLLIPGAAAIISS